MEIPDMSKESKELVGVFPFKPAEKSCLQKRCESPIKPDENNTTGIQVLIVGCMIMIGLAIWLM